MKLLRSVWLSALLTVAIVGCGESSGPATYSVTGTVTLDGKPLERGRVVLRDPEVNVATSGGEVVDGEFSFESLPGTKQVEITAHREVPGQFDESNPGVKTPVIEQYIPRKYNAASTLTEEVAAGENHFTFELTSDE